MTAQRESGYYWVKLDASSDWSIAEWENHTGRWRFKCVQIEIDTLFHTINETRILTPDEQPDLKRFEAFEEMDKLDGHITAKFTMSSALFAKTMLLWEEYFPADFKDFKPQVLEQLEKAESERQEQ